MYEHSPWAQPDVSAQGTHCGGGGPFLSSVCLGRWWHAELNSHTGVHSVMGTTVDSMEGQLGGAGEGCGHSTQRDRQGP